MEFLVATCMVAGMPRRELTIRAAFAPTRSSSLQLQAAYEMVMPQIEYLKVGSQRPREARSEQKRRFQRRGRQ